jgi:putative transposase
MNLKMARLTRVSPVGVPQHIVQRGNNRQVFFGSEEDMKAYLNWLK